MDGSVGEIFGWFGRAAYVFPAFVGFCLVGWLDCWKWFGATCSIESAGPLCRVELWVRAHDRDQVVDLVQCCWGIKW